MTSIDSTKPFNHVSRELSSLSEGLKPLDESCEEDVEKLDLEKMEENIEGMLTKLQNEGDQLAAKHAAVQSFTGLHEFLSTNVGTLKNTVTQTLDVLESLFPKDIENAAWLEKDSTIFKDSLHWLQLLLSTLNLGLQGTSLICKSRVLAKIRELLTLEKEKQGLTPDLEARLIKLEAQEKELQTKKALYFNKAGMHGMKVAKIPLNLIRGFQLFAPIVKVASSALTWGSSIFGFILAAGMIKGKVHNAEEYEEWVKAFQQEAACPNVAMAKELLEKRKQAMQAKIAKLEGEGGAAPLIPEITQTLLRQAFQFLKPHTDSSKETQREVVSAYLKEQFFPFLLTKEFSPIPLTADEEDPVKKKRTEMEDIHKHFDEILAKITPTILTALTTYYQPNELALAEAPVKNLEKQLLESIPEPDLLDFYARHQETIEHQLKNSLLQMVSTKHQMEKTFINLDLRQSKTIFSLSTLTLAASVALAVLGLITTPIGGVGLIFLGLSTLSFSLSLGFSIAGYYYASKQRPHLTWECLKWTDIRLLYAELRLNIAKYQLGQVAAQYHETTEKVITTSATPLASLPTTLAQTKEKVRIWSEQVETLRERLSRAAWRDFLSHHSSKQLKAEESTEILEDFNQAMKECNFQLLGQTTRTFLERQLGMDVEKIKKEMTDSPEALKNALKKLFVFDESELIKFIKTQKAAPHPSPTGAFAQNI